MKQIQGIVLLLIVFQLMGCNFFSAGTLGGFPPITFPTTKTKLELAIDRLYKEHPEYAMPAKWKDRDTWSARGYDFLESRIFYFSANPEEMYYVTFIGDEDIDNLTTATIAIRAVESKTENWSTYDELKEPRRQEMIKRFQSEIIEKLESYSGTKSRDGY